MKKHSWLLIFLGILFILKYATANIGVIFALLLLVGIIFWASTVKEEAPSLKIDEKEEEKKEPKKVIPIKMTGNYKKIGPTKFVLENKKRIDKAVKKVNCYMIWDSSCAEGFNNRETFIQKIETASHKRFKVKIVMDKEGPVKLVFIGKNLADINLVKVEKKNTPKPKEQELINPPQNKPKEQQKPKAKPKKSNAEEKGNVIINKDGKPEVKPNYRMIASDWINTSLEYLNKVCNDTAAICGGDEIHAQLDASDLPPDKEAWEAIGILLKEQDEIDAFEVNENGIAITIE